MKDDINEIIPGLFISSIFPAESVETLNKYKITHVLTVSYGI
jgi:hypothetical protein